MQAKRAIMQRSRTFTPHDTKHRAGHTVAASNHLTAELATLVAAYTGVVTVCEKGKELARMGKNKRQFDAPSKLDQYKGGGAKYAPQRKRPDDLVAPLRGAMVCCAWDEAARFTLVKRQDR